MKIINIEFDGIDTNDYPKFCDAYIIYAEYENGIRLTDSELDELNDNGAFVHEKLQDYLF